MKRSILSRVIARLANPKRLAAASSLSIKAFAHSCLRKIFLFETWRRTQGLAGIKVDPIGVIHERTGIAEIVFPPELLQAAIAKAEQHFATVDWEAVRATSEKKYLLTSPLENRVPSLDDPIFNLALYPPLVKMIGNYLGMLPVIENILIWHSPNDGPVTPDGSQFYHLDGQDVRTLQLFIFLNDIGDDSGPLKVVNADASARIAKAINYRKSGKYRRIDDAVVEQYARPDEVVTITGKAGSVFIADTDRCFHYGSRGGKKPRHQLVVQYYTPYAFAIPFRWWRALPFGSCRVGEGLSKVDKLVLGQKF